jgi:hypothetical protein
VTNEAVKKCELYIRTALNKVNLCHCGSGEQTWGIVLGILERAATHSHDHPERAKSLPFYDPMPDRDLSGAAVEFAAHVLAGVDMLEYGSSIGWAWLTGPGATVLAFLRKYGCDIHGWPEYATSSSLPEQHELTWEQWNPWRLSHDEVAIP